MINLRQIEKQTIQAAETTADFIRQECAQFDRARVEQKGSFANLVSYVDRAAEERLSADLQKILPESGILGEEGTNRAGDSGYQWIVDPLDGTTNFIHQFPMFCISIGLTFNNTLVLGVIYDVMRRECYHAVQDGEAYCNDRRIQVSAVATLQESLIATGFPHTMNKKQDEFWKILRSFQMKTQGFRRLGSAALDLAYVACGRLDGFFESGLQPWDVAAGAFIVRQAGGTVTDFSGGENFIFGGEVCAAGPAHPLMMEVIRQYDQ